MSDEKIEMHECCENKDHLFTERGVCHDCGAKEGEIHELGCDMEVCPFCSGQLISCGCRYEKLGFDYIPLEKQHPSTFFQQGNHSGLPDDIYENGLTDELREEWEVILKRRGRIPYIRYPNMCVKCGKLWPDMFNVTDEDWKKYVSPRYRNRMLCLECYKQIKEWIDESNA